MSKIDFVIPWVDGSDPEWISERDAYSKNRDGSDPANGDDRYRDWGLLKYFFRSIAKNAPWSEQFIFSLGDICPLGSMSHIQN